MVNLILNAITKQLGDRFGSSYRYYVETVEQNLTKPCFTVDVLIPLRRLKKHILCDRTMPIVIHYFAKDTNNLKQNSYDMGEEIVDCLEYLSFEGTLLRGENISYQMVDDVLQVFITYKFTTIKNTESEEINIETLSNTNIKTNKI